MAITDIPDKAPGMRSYVVYGGVTLPVTRTNLRVTRNLADCTDSSDYDGDADIIGKTQLPISAVCEGTIEGRYRRSTTPSAVVAGLFTGVIGVPMQFGLDSGTVVGHGYFDISEFSQDMPVEDVVNWTCTVRSNGLFVPNS